MDIKIFCQKFGFTPKNINLFNQALTHPTYSNENREAKNYQRLEFLGDAILSMVVGLKIFELYRNYDEGQMSLFKSKLVNSQSLASLTLSIKLVDFIRVGNSLKNIHENQKILADIFEAFVAAIFIDQGIKKVNNFLDQTLFKTIKKVNKKELKNPKTLLQEHLQSDSRKIIEYVTVSSHDAFLSKILCNNITYGQGRGRTKQLAEVAAAEDALKKVKKG